MRILQFIETGGTGGAEQVVLKLSVQLQKMGHSVFVATLREGWLTEELDKFNISRIKFNSNKSFDLSLIKQIFSFCRNNKIDIIHSHLLDSNFYCSIASLLINIPCICTEHGDIHHSNKKKFLKFKTKITSLCAKKISSVSEYSKKALIEAGMNSAKICLIRNPIEINESVQQNLSREDISTLVQEDDWIWAHVGNFRPVKDQKTLIMGFNEALKKSPVKQKLLLIGDGKLREELQKLVKDYALEKNVIFLGHRTDISSILPLCNGFILSSLSEAMPMSILEAIRANLIVVSSKVGGIPELIQNNITGFLFEAQNYIELGNTLANILENKKDALNTINEAKKSVLNECETQKITSKFLDLYSLA